MLINNGGKRMLDIQKKKLEINQNEVVCVVAFDKRTRYIRTITSCKRKDANHYARYYRSIGYIARILTYEELEKAQAEEAKERRNKQMTI